MSYVEKISLTRSSTQLSGRITYGSEFLPSDPKKEILIMFTTKE